jgi:hypothetical protein
MPADCENWPITVTLLGATGKDECRQQSRVGTIGSVQSTRKNRTAFDNQRDCQTVRAPNYENREEIVVYQQNAAVIFRGKTFDF